MKFKDELNIDWKRRLKTFRLRARMKKLYSQQIKSDLEQLDLMQMSISDSEKQISEWENMINDKSYSHLHKEIQNNIELAKAYNAYLRKECYVLLIELDLYVAIKNLFIATDNWEVRFFARRCFTLMYEMNQSFDKASTTDIKIFREKVDTGRLKQYDDSKDKLLKFLKPHLKFFQEIRNAGEAHKDKDYTRQIKALESISIKDSYDIIFHFFILLLDLSKKSFQISKNLYLLYSEQLKSELGKLTE